MIKKLFFKWQAYKDKLFLKRLNRVLADNILESDVVTMRNLMFPDWKGGMIFKPKDRDNMFGPIVKGIDGHYYYQAYLDGKSVLNAEELRKKCYD